MADFGGGEIQAFVGPPLLGAADDLEQVIVDFIDGAEQSLDIAVQEIDSERIAQAILDARFRHVAVRIFLEHSYIQTDLTGEAIDALAADPAAAQAAQWEEARPSPDFRTNRDILTAFLRSDIEVHSDFNKDIFHQKFVIRDAKSGGPPPALLTGSANFTGTDSLVNLNHVVIFHNADIVDKYEIEFAEMASGSFGRQRLGKVPRGYNLGGVPVKVLFAPDHAPELEISKHINKCRDRLDFAIFTFSGSSGIDDAMMMLKRAGIAVRGAIDPGQGRFGWAPTRRLHEAGVEVFLPREEAPFRKLHHKLMVIDDAAVIAGSFNYTGNANDYNDENIFVIGSPHPDLPNSEGGPVDVDECAAICAFFRAEIDRIIGDLSDVFQP